jgi:hypothetical protein
MGITKQQSSSKLTQEQYWKEHVAKQKRSGLPATVYCRQHQINYDHFYYWIRKGKRTESRLIPIELRPTEVNTPGLAMVSPVLCTIRLRSGHVLSVHDKSAIPLLLSALS